MKRKKWILMALLALLGAFLAGCKSQAQTANENITKAADNFEVLRKIVGINGITDKVLFTVEGFCSYNSDQDPGNFEAVCKNPDGTYSRTVLHLSDNVTVVVAQEQGAHVSGFRPRVIFRPESIIPNFDLSTSSNP